MSESIEHAREGIERAHHAHEHEADSSARWVAVLVALFAAALALADVGEKAAQTTFLMNHISMTDDYAYYQAKNLRLGLLQNTVAVLQSLPDAASPAVATRIQTAEAAQAVLKDDPAHRNGMKQLLVTAERHRRQADHSLHREHGFAGAAGALQIAILLASVSIVTRMTALRWGAGLIGATAIGFGLLVWSGMV